MWRSTIPAGLFRSGASDLKRSHAPRPVTLESTIFINAGTTGAAECAGSRPVRIPTAWLFSFDRSEGERQTLVMADLLSVHQNQDSFTLQRYYNQNSLQPVTMESSHGAGEEQDEAEQPDIR